MLKLVYPGCYRSFRKRKSWNDRYLGRGATRVPAPWASGWNPGSLAIDGCTHLQEVNISTFMATDRK